LFLAPFFFLYGAIGVAFPFFSLWLKDWGLADPQIAVIMSLHGLAVITWSQLWGYAGDMLLKRKTLLMLNAFAAVLFFSLLPWTHAFWLIALVTFCFASFVTPNGQILNSLLLSQERGERRYALIRSAGTAGFIVVNLFIGAMSVRYGTSVVFLFYGMTLLLFTMCLVPIHEAPRLRRRKRAGKKTGASDLTTTHPVSEGDPNIAGGSLSAAPDRVGFLEAQAIFWRRLAIRRFLVFVVIYQIGHALSHHFQGIWVRQLGGDDRIVSYAYSLAAGSELILLWVVDRILAKRSAAPFLVLAALAEALRWGLLYLVPVLWVTVASNVFHAITFGIFYAAGIVYIHRLSPGTLRTTGQTLYGLAYFGIAALGSNLLGSAIIDWYGLRTWYGVAALLGLVAAVQALRIPREDYPRGVSG